MSLTNVFQISSQGMAAQRERLEASIANLANANTTRTQDGAPYRRRDVVFEVKPMEPTAATEGSLFPTGSLFDTPENGTASLQGVTSMTLVQDVNPTLKQYQPNHPDADSNGYVTLPDVNPLEETVNILSATRAFEANVTAFNTVKEMARTSLKLFEG